MADLLIPARPAPAERIRLNSKSLQDAVKARGARYTRAKDEILGTKRLRETMQDWLATKGMYLDPAVQTDDVQLQQLMLYWHLCEPWVQDKIALMRPVFHLEIPQISAEFAPDIARLNAEKAADPSQAARVDAAIKARIASERGAMTLEMGPQGADSLNLLDDGTVSNVVIFGRNKARRFFVPAGLDVSNKKNFLNDVNMLPNYKHDGGFATIYHRYDLADVLAGESDGPTNLYTLFFFAHEITHALQNCFEPICRLEPAMVDAFTRFRLLANQEERVPLYRRWVRDDASTNPDNLGVYARPLRGDHQLAHHQVPFEVFTYLNGARLPLPADARVGQLAEHFGLAVLNGTICPTEFMNLMFADLKRVIGPLITSQINFDLPEHCYALSTSVPFAAQYKRVTDYLSLNMNNNVPDGPLPALGLRPAVGYPVRQPPNAGVPSLLDAILAMIAAATNHGLTPIQATTLRTQIQDLQQKGFAALRNAVEVWHVKTARSVAMQRHASQLFPDLIGAFTDYSNGEFKNALHATAVHVSGLFIKHGIFAPGDPDEELWNLFPNDMQRSILAARGNHVFARVEDVKAHVSPLQLYALGAPLGIFNVYTQEWDAEAYAMWTCCPEEFEAMYKRVEAEWPKPWSQVWNMVTYASVRGIEETEGIRVPTYKDL